MNQSSPLPIACQYANAQAKSDIETSTVRAISWRLIPFLVLAYFFSYLDRVNFSFAALTMNAELKFSPIRLPIGKNFRSAFMVSAAKPRLTRSR